MKFDDAPRLSKLPFLLGNVALLALAWFIYAHHPNPFSPIPLFFIFVFFLVGILASMVPFVVNYNRDQADAATSLRHELDEQFKRIMAASEHLQNSILQLKSIEQTATSSAEAARQLPSVIQEKIADFNRQLAAAENKERARLEQELARLRSSENERQAGVAAQIAAALAEWVKVEADARRGVAEIMQKEKELFDDQAARLRVAEEERQAAAGARITDALAEWTKIEAEARQGLAAMMQREKESFEQQAVTLRSTDRERQTAAAAQIANALADWARIEADARMSLAATVKREKESFEQQVIALRSTETARLAAAAEEITMTLASWTGIEAGVRRQLAAATELHEKLNGTFSALDSRIVGLQAAVESAVKAAETLSAAQPPPAIVLPAPAPAEVEPVVVAAALVEAVAATPAEPSPAAIEPVAVPEAAPEMLPDWRALLEPALSIPEATAPVELPPVVAPESPVVPEQAPEVAEALPAVDETPVVPEAIAQPEFQTPPPSAEAAAIPVVDDTPPPVPAPEITPLPEAPEPPPAAEASAAPIVAEIPPPVFAPEVAPAAELPLAIEPTPELPAVTPASEAPAADSPASGADEPEPPPPSAESPDTIAPAKPRKPRAPRKPRTESTPPTGPVEETVAGPDSDAEGSPESPPSVELISEPIVDEPSPPEDFSQVPPEEKKPAANASSDGRTRLTVTSYIGIGNKLHIRGEGPGLSWSKGVPLQFVSIGRWRWETDKAAGSVICKIYKNDRLEAPNGEITILPGTEQEISATF